MTVSDRDTIPSRTQLTDFNRVKKCLGRKKGPALVTERLKWIYVSKNLQVFLSKVGKKEDLR